MLAAVRPSDVTDESRRSLPFPWHDVRLLQTPLSLLVLLSVVLSSSGGESEITDVSQVAAILLAVGLLLVTVLQREATGTRLAMASICALDLALMGLAGFATHDGAAALLAVLPAMWLGAWFGRAGAVLAGGLSFLLVSLPWLVSDGFSGASLAQGVPLPFVAGIAALAVAEGLASARRERRRAGESARDLALARAKLELETLRIGIVLDTAGVGLMLIDADGALDYVNPLAKPMLLLGNPHSGRPEANGALFRADGVTPLPYDERPIPLVVAGEEFDDLRMWVGADSTTRRLVSVSGRQVSPPGSERRGGVVAFHDITSSERDLRLRASFLDTIAHELRTPLTALDGYLHLLGDVDDLPDEAAELLPALRRSSERLGRLSAELVAQGGRTPLPLVVQKVDVSALVAEVCDGRRLSATACQVHLDVHVTRGIHAEVDPGQLSRAVEILLDRALEAAPEGSVVGVAAAQERGSLDISVADQGPGIDSSRHLTIFAPTSVTNGAEALERRTGLPYAHAVAVAHRGRIEVDSRLGTGAMFVIRLPLHYVGA